MDTLNCELADTGMTKAGTKMTQNIHILPFQYNVKQCQLSQCYTNAKLETI